MATKTTTQNLGLTDEQRDAIVKLDSHGLNRMEIAQIVNCTDSTVSNVLIMYRLVKDGKLDEAEQRAANGQGVVFRWATERLGKKLPQKQPEAPVESGKCKLDDEQIGRIMYALGKMEEHLEALTQELVLLRKEQNANTDILRNVISSFNNTVLMEMRKRK